MQPFIKFTEDISETFVTFDSAIDFTKSKIKDFIQTRDNSCLVFKKPPTKFFIRNLPQPAVKAITNEFGKNPAQLNELFFQLGVVKVENMKNDVCAQEVQFNNNGLTMWEPTGKWEYKNYSFKVCDNELNEIDFFHTATVQEIGEYIKKKVSYPKGIKPTYQISLLSMDLITAVMLLKE